MSLNLLAQSNFNSGAIANSGSAYSNTNPESPDPDPDLNPDQPEIIKPIEIGLSTTPDSIHVNFPSDKTIFEQKVSYYVISKSEYTVEYELALNSKTHDTAMRPLSNNNDMVIKPSTGTVEHPIRPSDMENNTYCVEKFYDNKCIGLTNPKNPIEIAVGSIPADQFIEIRQQKERYSVGVRWHFRLDDPASFPADTYTANATYTLTAREVIPTPIIESNLPTAYEVGDSNNKLTITGKNLETATSVYVGTKGNPINKAGECTITNKTSTTIDCNLPTNLDTGTYPITVTTRGGTATKPNAIEYYVIDYQVCRNGDNSSTCQVDIDDNMFPIAWDSNNNLKLLTDTDLTTNPGSWYDYNQKKWANAVTFADNETTSGGVYCNTYGNIDWVSMPSGVPMCQRNGGSVITNVRTILTLYKKGEIYSFSSSAKDYLRSDFTSNMILGYWTYIPRYAYEVMRPNAIDRVVTDTQAIAEGGFNIRFETATDIKKTPAPTCSTVSGTTLTAKDYRTECNIDRTYPGNDKTKANKTTWATHPAFTFGNTELNGLWIGKFETTGTRTNPTIKPNQHANISEYIGTFYDIAKGIGVPDSNNTYGGSNANISINQNSHNLSTYHSHMLKNSEWGAITYLSASTYGAGVNNVKNNGAYPTTSADADGTSSRYGVTGCGPAGKVDIPSTGTYTDGTPLTATTIESPTACSTSTDRSWTSPIGQLASTTNNIYGIYDMAGGAWEYVMGNRTTADGITTSNTTYFKNPTKPPYVDLYPTSAGFGTEPAWSQSTNEYRYNNDVCTWGVCGGHALNETKKVQSVSSFVQSWGSGSSYFVYSDSPWFKRGGNSSLGSNAGVFASSYDYSNSSSSSSSSFGSRSVLVQH